MFESTKAANFQATITIHELQNVPQLAGDFAVKWKFQGRRPRGKDASESKAVDLADDSQTSQAGTQAVPAQSPNTASYNATPLVVLDINLV